MVFVDDPLGDVWAAFIIDVATLVLPAPMGVTVDVTVEFASAVNVSDADNVPARSTPSVSKAIVNVVIS